MAERTITLKRLRLIACALNCAGAVISFAFIVRGVYALVPMLIAQVINMAIFFYLYQHTPKEKRKDSD